MELVPLITRSGLKTLHSKNHNLKQT